MAISTLGYQDLGSSVFYRAFLTSVAQKLEQKCAMFLLRTGLAPSECTLVSFRGKHFPQWRGAVPTKKALPLSGKQQPAVPSQEEVYRRALVRIESLGTERRLIDSTFQYRCRWCMAQPAYGMGLLDHEWDCPVRTARKALVRRT